MFRVGISGAVMESTGQLSYGQELLAVLAGPGVNLLLAGVAGTLGETGEIFAGANLVLCGFNLLPLRPLDGGKALYLLLSWWGGPDFGERISQWIGLLTGSAFAALLLVYVWESQGSLWLLAAIGGIVKAIRSSFS